MPLARGERPKASPGSPPLSVGGEAYILMTTDIAALPRARLGAHVTNIETDHRDDITGALDMLFTGF